MGDEKKVLNDEQLVNRCLEDDEGALKELYCRYNGMLLNHLYRMLADRTRAEDLTEETFFRVWQKASLFDASKGSFKTWLFRMATRLAINKIKKRVRRERLAPSVPLCNHEAATQAPSPHEEARRSEARERVRDALTALNDKDRSVLVLRHLEGLEEKEVARVLGIPRGTVKSRTYYALRRLKTALNGVGL